MREVREILQALNGCEKARELCVLARVLSTQGSTYRKPGASALFREDGSSVGLISGGCLEQDIAEHVKILLRTVGAVTKPTTEIVSRREERGERRVHETYTSETRDETTQKELSGRLSKGTAAAADGETTREVAEAPLLKVLTYDTSSSQDIVMGLGLGCEGLVQVGLYLVKEQGFDWVRSLFPSPETWLVCGAGEDAKPLVELVSFFGYDCWLLDRREAVLEAFPVFPGVSKVLWEAGQKLPAASVVLILNHHYETDLSQLKQIFDFRSPVYCGVLGPRARTERLLKELGLGTPAPFWLHTPMGLDLGGDSPSSIALSIVAEAHAKLHGRSGTPLRQKLGSIHSEVAL